MTLAERELLLTLAWAVKGQMQFIGIDQPYPREGADRMVERLSANMDAFLASVPTPLTPRPKYVKIERSPDNRGLRCQACGGMSMILVRVGEYRGVSTLLCPACIREAAALLDSQGD